MLKLKDALKRNAPWLVPFVRAVKINTLKYRSSISIFERIYEENEWGDPESVSGPGSNLAQSSQVREHLPKILKSIGAETLLDIPCGDYWWMKEVNLNLDQYIGADVVAQLISDNNEKYGASNRQFECLDITTDKLPRTDLILCRDLLVHFTNREVFRSIQNIRSSNSTYLLMTTFTGIEENIDIVSGEWRPIDFQLPPFEFPPPLEIFDDSGNNTHRNKYLGLWRVSDI
jgi:hypothetical protein